LNANQTATAMTVTGKLNPNEPANTITGIGTLTVSSGGTLMVKAATITANYGASTITVSAGSTISYAASTINQTVSNSFTYTTLRIAGGLVKTLAGNLTSLRSSNAAYGNIYVDAGTLDLSTFTANRGTSTTGGAFTVANGASLLIAGTNAFPTNYAAVSLAPSSTVSYSGTNQTITSET